LIDLHLHGVGLIGPGLTGWAECRDILQGRVAWTQQPLRIPPSTLLPATERRRCNESSRLAIAAAEQALHGSDIRPADIAAVFTSADGDGMITHKLCESFAMAEPEVSPTQFHNSVHNAPAGYWSIATGSSRPSTTLAAGAGSFAAGLFEAALQVMAEPAPVLLVAFDLPLPHPLCLMQARTHGFAVALLIGRERRGNSIAALQLVLEGNAAESALPAGFGALSDNPAARALPLLDALANDGRTTAYVGAIGADQLGVRCHP
jgi:hypothetical protein